MELYNNGAQQILSFGPAIIIDCESADSSNITRGSVKKPNPRTAIGIIDELHYIFVVCDGRTEKSRGVTVNEMAEFMLDFGTVTAYNLDGGGSATMYFNGEIINTPTHNGEDIEERNVSDIVYIGY
jgi:exopolysaccharide biosynthesis protein